MVDAQMGGAGRRASLGTMDYTDRLPYRSFNRSPFARTFDYPCAGIHLLFPKIQAYHRQGSYLCYAYSIGHFRLHQRNHHPLHRIHRSYGGCLFRKHAGASCQFWYCNIRNCRFGSTVLWRMAYTQGWPQNLESASTLNDDDSYRLLVIRYRYNSCRCKSADEQQQSEQSARIAVVPQSRSVWRTSSALWRILFIAN